VLRLVRVGELGSVASKIDVLGAASETVSR